MKFKPLYKDGPVLIELEKHADDRGFFARSLCEEELKKAELPTFWPQMNISFNDKVGTVRGMHFQTPPYEEPKIVRCTAGMIFDAVIDLRQSSPHYCQSFGVELSADNRQSLYIPAGFAHGFQTLEENTEVLYVMGATFEPNAANGVRWDDPAFDLQWPIDISVISDRDAAYPYMSEERQFFV